VLALVDVTINALVPSGVAVTACFAVADAALAQVTVYTPVPPLDTEDIFTPSTVVALVIKPHASGVRVESAKASGVIARVASVPVSASAVVASSTNPAADVVATLAASAAGVTALSVSVPVTHSASVASSTNPETVVLAAGVITNAVPPRFIAVASRVATVVVPVKVGAARSAFVAIAVAMALYSSSCAVPVMIFPLSPGGSASLAAKSVIFV